MTSSSLAWRRAILLRGPVLASLAGVLLLSWWYLVDMAASMNGMPALMDWTPGYARMMVLMWIIMMIGMMLPSAIPMILIYLQVARHNRMPSPTLGTLYFIAGYLAVWSAFAVLATLLQWQMEGANLLSARMASHYHLLSAALLVLAGVYQWTPFKEHCLRHCQGPLQFIARHWRTGLSGAFGMGLIHGAYCLGCCWLLMGLLFVGGVMNLLLVALLAALVLLEKALMPGLIFARTAGIVLIVIGLAQATQG